MSYLTEMLIDTANEPDATRVTMAHAYRYALGHRTDADDVDWKTANAAIIERWSSSGLDTIKRWAWNGIPNGRGGKN